MQNRRTSLMSEDNKKGCKLFSIILISYTLCNVVYYLIPYFLSFDDPNLFYVQADNWQYSIIYAPAILLFAVIGIKLLRVIDAGWKITIKTILFVVLIAFVNLLFISIQSVLRA
jgi:hypothetical protein